ncbi:MAG: hypothetical protein II767_12625 [Proteobacteria bacterium]|nr:hypothetical protein [Pseudomonadota bacterium]
MSLKNLIATDIKSVFLGDAEDYGEALKIGISSSNVVNTFGSLQNNLIDNNTGTNPLQSYAWMLLVPTMDIAELHIRVGQTIYVNDTAYKVTTISDEMGVSNIGLLKGN